MITLFYRYTISDHAILLVNNLHLALSALSKLRDLAVFQNDSSTLYYLHTVMEGKNENMEKWKDEQWRAKNDGVTNISFTMISTLKHTRSTIILAKKTREITMITKLNHSEPKDTRVLLKMGRELRQLDTRVLTWVISNLRYPRTAYLGNGDLKLPITVKWLRVVTIHNHTLFFARM